MSDNVRYKPGDIVQKDCQPFIKFLIPELRGQYCINCFKLSSNIQSCSSCNKLKYCSKKCQVADWKRSHKLECKSEFFRSLGPGGTPGPFSASYELAYQLIRMHALLTLNPELRVKKFVLYDGVQTKSFADLFSHKVNFATINAALPVQEMCSYLEETLKNSESPHDRALYSGQPGHFLEFFGILQTNACSIYNDAGTGKIGQGLFIEPAHFIHSCKPTAFFALKGTSMQIRAIGSILVGEEPTISYISSHMNREKRREIIHLLYNYQCECPRCVSYEDHDVDFVELNRKIDNFRHEISSGIPTAGSNWKDVLKNHKEILDTFQKMYYKYDDRVTNQMVRLCDVGFTRAIPHTTMKGVIIETKKRLWNTYGEESYDLKAFSEKLLSVAYYDW